MSGAGGTGASGDGAGIAPPTLSLPSPTSLKRLSALLESTYHKHIVETKVPWGHLKTVPTEYWEIRAKRPDPESADWDARMDWAAWEQAVSLLDEATKAAWAASFVMDAASVAVVTDFYEKWLPKKDVPYVAPHAVPMLYYAHLFSMRAGLATAGVLRLEGRFLVRKSARAVRWAPGDGMWKPRDKSAAQKEISMAYDWCQRQIEWLPARTGAQRGLRLIRDDYTYDPQSAGTGSYKHHVASMPGLLRTHVSFSLSILQTLEQLVRPCESLEEPGDTYRPSWRTPNLRQRLEGLSQRLASV